MREFKIGDRVKVVKSTFFTDGEIDGRMGVVVDVDRDGDPVVKLEDWTGGHIHVGDYLSDITDLYYSDASSGDIIKVGGLGQETSAVDNPSHYTDAPVNNQGIKFDQDKLSWEVDFEFLEEIAKRMEVSSKYPPYNWHKPLEPNKILTAGFRHYTQLMKGDLEDDGQEFGHIFAVVTNLMMYYYQIKTYRNEH